MFSNSGPSKINLINDSESKNVYERLNHELNVNPDENYSIHETAITDLMNVHFERKSKVQQKYYKKDPWITYGILNSVILKIDFIKTFQNYL